MLCIAIFFTKSAEAKGLIARRHSSLDTVLPNEEGPLSRQLWTGRVGAYFGSQPMLDYHALENWCSSFIQSKTRQIDGRWTIDIYFFGIWDYFSGESPELNSWDKDYQKIRRWRAAYPQSACAPLVEAKYWEAYAWHTRGGDYADTVTSEGWQLFAQRLAKADKVLEESRSLASVNPVWYDAKISVGLGLQKSSGEMLSTLSTGMKTFPDYFQSIFAMAKQLLPEWGGNWAVIDKFVHAVVEGTEKKQQRVIYARLYWYLNEMEVDPLKFFSETLVSWPDMKSGFDDLMASYPESKWNLNNYASFACLADDKPTYLQQRERIAKIGFYGAAWYSRLPVEVCDRHFGFK